MFDINSKVDEWKKKALAGTLTRDEMKEAIILLRGQRKMSVEVQAVKKEKAVKPNVKSLLDDFASQMTPKIKE
jgi:hypothetical protein